MRLRHIEVFHAVYSTGTVTRAARLLNVSQPSISKVLAHAEQQLGYALFDRVKGKLIPTPEADILFEHVEPVNNRLDRLRSVAENLREADEGVLRLAATPAFGLDLLPRTMSSWLGHHPKTFFVVETLHYSEICHALLDGTLDIGLVFDHSPEPLIEEEFLAEGRFFVIAHANSEFCVNHADRDSLSLADLADFPFIELGIRGPLGKRLFDHATLSAANLNTVARCETYQMAKGLVANGAGIAVIDEITARSGDPGSLRYWPFQPELSFRISALHWRSAPLSQLGKRFLRHLGQELCEFLA